MAGLSILFTTRSQARSTSGDPLGSLQWPDLRREFFGNRLSGAIG